MNLRAAFFAVVVASASGCNCTDRIVSLGNDENVRPGPMPVFGGPDLETYDAGEPVVAAPDAGFEPVDAGQPEPVDAGPVHLPAKQMAIGDGHGCMLAMDNTLWCWGRNASGELGLGSDAGTAPLTQVASEGTSVAIVSTGIGTCVKHTDGSGACWGPNRWGAAADPSGALFRPVPGPLPVIGSDVAAVSAGYLTGCAVRTDRTVWCWGSNAYSQLGMAWDTASHPVPREVPMPMSDFVEVQAGQYLVCARKSDDTLWCWGSQEGGGLGNGVATSSMHVMTPGPVVGLGPIASFSVGETNNVCAVKKDGSLWCWGENQYGQLGLGAMDSMPHPMPVEVTALGHDVVQVVAIGYSTCAVKADRSAWCWGWNVGNLCTPSAAYISPSPEQVTAVGNDVQAVGMGYGFTCFLRGNGGIDCCGGNGYGQLGLPADRMQHLGLNRVN